MEKIWCRDYGVMYSEVAILSVNQIYLLKSVIINGCYYADGCDKMVEVIVDEYGNDFVARFHECGKKYVELTKNLDPDGDLKKQFLEFHKVWVDYSEFVWRAFFLNDYFAAKASVVIKEKGYDPNLLQPREKTELVKLKERLLTEDAKDLWEEYQWIPCLDIHKKPFTLQEFVRFAEPAKPLEVKDVDDFVINVARDLAYVKDARDDYRRKGVFYFRKWLKKVSEIMGISVEDISYITKDEFLKKIDQAEIEKRKKCFMVGDSFSSNPVEIERFKIDNGISDDNITSNVTEVKGIVAMKGKATGKVLLLHSYHDIKRAQKGDVLVAITTHPDYLPAMQKAVAFVTDEGGVTCHASIVAREMGKPCVIGTKIATKVFKDGDLVEVDADKGLVRKVTGG